VTVKAGMTMETMDDYSIDTDTPETNNYTMFSGKFTFGNMAVDVSMVNATMKNVSKSAVIPSTTLAALPAAVTTMLSSYPSEFEFGVTGLGFQMKQLGPGDLNVNYEAVTLEDTTKATGMAAIALKSFNQSTTIAATSVFYTIKISEKIGYQIVYDSKTKTPDVGDATTASFLGVGLFGFF